MTARKHDASTRFWNFARLYQCFGPSAANIDWNDPAEFLARLPLSCVLVPGNPFDDAIALAFRETAFDIRDPLQWKLLLGIFCIAHFGEWKRPGAHKVWTTARLEELDKDAAEIRSRHPDFSDQAVARNLQKSGREKYGQFSVSYLRERLADVRNSKQESEKMLAAHLVSVRGLYKIVGFEWTSEVEARVVQSFTETRRQISATR